MITPMPSATGTTTGGTNQFQKFDDIRRPLHLEKNSGSCRACSNKDYEVICWLDLSGCLLPAFWFYSGFALLSSGVEGVFGFHLERHWTKGARLGHTVPAYEDVQYKPSSAQSGFK